jgi:hypothetical protein
MFALFNKDKNFIGYSNDIPDNSCILKKEIPPETSDMLLWRWEGDYDNGKMISIGMGYPIEEIELEKKFFNDINKKYPIETQFLNIIKQLKKIVQHNQDMIDDDFIDMADCIINAEDKYNKRINYYRNYERLILKNESEEQFKNIFGK